MTACTSSEMPKTLDAAEGVEVGAAMWWLSYNLARQCGTETDGGCRGRNCDG